MTNETILIRLFCILLWVITPASAQAQATPPLIAVAANLQFAVQEIAQAFQAQSDEPLRFSFASSGHLTRQIKHGAPFELFLSANRTYVEQLERDGLTRGPERVFALGQLVLLLPKGSSIQSDAHLQGLLQAHADGRLKRLALANPEHAPYGLAARQALSTLNAWDALRPSMVLGESVAQATQFVAAGAADAGLVSLSLALTPALETSTHFYVLPDSLYRPLAQTAVLLPSASAVSQRFFEFLGSASAQSILQRYGYHASDE